MFIVKVLGDSFHPLKKSLISKVDFTLLKVSKSRKQITLCLLLPKNEPKT